MAGRKTGRPARTDPPKRDKVPEILRRIASGQSLREICRDENMPSREAFFEWLDQDKDLRRKYREATRRRADALFDEMFEIADDARNDWLERQTKSGETYEVLNREAVMRSALRVDLRKWALVRMNPKRYGDKVDLKHGGRVKVITLSRDDENI